MEKLIEKVENLKLVLDNNENIKKIKTKNKEIVIDKELLKLIEKYNITQDEKIKERILASKSFQEYKEAETDINLIILEINQRLKELSKRGNCNL